ncbi:MAG TPA: ribose-phosphate pyrophosphokinase, partial [bacterium]|nr:ribose-phosphate pyrophosphokinase [bacterium]
MIIFTGNSNRKLADAIAEKIGIKLGDAFVGKFPEGEVNVSINDNVRGKDVFVIQ